ncbi:MAG: hypothetical protein JSV54_00455 [Chloroflexota bacterium]|nr:MAG: hypothetical protein JSV54_00455 [Chloroflexota bacterium]
MIAKRVSIVFIVFGILFAIWTAFRLFTGDLVLWLGILYLAGIILLVIWFSLTYRKLTNRTAIHSLDVTSQALDTKPSIKFTDDLVYRLVKELLIDEQVKERIKSDINKTRLIGHKEQWRLGLISPDIDTFNPWNKGKTLTERLKKGVGDPVSRYNVLEKIPLKRTAVLHNKNYINLRGNCILIIGGTKKPVIKSYPLWQYPLATQINKGEFTRIRDVKINTDIYKDRSPVLPEFLKEDGFPLKEFYEDGDPLTAERGGTIVADKGKFFIIYTEYFVQKRVIDDDGNLIYLGLDEDKPNEANYGVMIKPSISSKLIQYISSRGFTPILRYRSFPYASDIMLPIIDTPMSCSGWADLFIDTRGAARLFVAKDKAPDEWNVMMQRLQQLFRNTLQTAEYHLLRLTKNKELLNKYLLEKQAILRDYYLIDDIGHYI